MDASLPRASRLPSGSAEPTYLVDPESGLPLVFGTSVVTTPGTSNGAILFTADLTGAYTLALQLTGTWTATVTFEATLDGTNWFSIPGFNVNGTSAAATSATANGAWVFPAYAKQLRGRVSAYTSGTINAAVFLTDVQTAALSNYGSVTITGSLSSGSSAIGDVGVQYRTTSTGAATIRKVLSAASTNATSVKTTAGRMVGYVFQNTSASVRYVKFFNKASAPTLGTDTPVLTVMVPANGEAKFSLEGGIGFATGLAFAITGAVADTDATAIGANDILGAIFYA